MDARLDLPTVGLFVLVVFPGLVSINIYRLIMPSRMLGWANAMLLGMFYSVVNLILGLPILFILVFGRDPLQHPVRYFTAMVLVLLVAPVLWPVGVKAVFRSKRLARWIHIPYPTVWDFVFENRDPMFVLVHLKTGEVLAGFWGNDSYAGSFPNDGDIYLEAVYHLTETGELSEPVQNSRGVILRKSEYFYVELLSAPESESEVRHVARS